MKSVYLCKVLPFKMYKKMAFSTSTELGNQSPWSNFRIFSSSPKESQYPSETLPMLPEPQIQATANLLYVFADLSILNISFFTLLFFIVIWLQLSQFFLFCPPLPSSCPTPTVNSYTVVQVHGSFIYVLWLASSPSFSHYPLPTSTWTTVSQLHVSMSLDQFCLLVNFVH